MDTMLLDSLTASRARDSLPSVAGLNALATFFDVTRLKIISALSVSAMCVTDLALVTSLNQTTVSHNLRTLRAAHVVECVRQGKVMFYSLAERNIPHIMSAAVGAVLRANNIS